MWATGSDPGFITETIPMALLSIQRRVDLIEIEEFGDLSRRPSAHMVMEQMRFGKPLSEFDPERRKNHLFGEYQPPLTVLADLAGFTIDEWTGEGGVAAAKQDLKIVAGQIKAGTAAAQRIIIRGRSGGVERIRFIQYGFVARDVEPDWGLQPTGWRIRIHGDAPFDLSMPFRFQKLGSGTWFGGTGDLSLGFKRMLASSLRTGSILSVSGEAVLPTGNAARGLGKGVTVFEGFASVGQLLPKDGFLQFQGGFEAPTHTDDAARAVFWRTVVGRSFAQEKGLGRLWSPMVELLADRELLKGEGINWDVVPQFQVTLSRRQHIRASAGFRIPVNNTGSRSTQVMFYLLWDWFDGGLRDGWK